MYGKRLNFNHEILVRNWFQTKDDPTPQMSTWPRSRHWQETWGLVHKRVLCYGEWDRLGILFLQTWSHTGVALFRNQIRHLRAGTNICRSLQRTDNHYVVPYCASGPNKKYTLLFEEQVNSDKGL